MVSAVYAICSREAEDRTLAPMASIYRQRADGSHTRLVLGLAMASEARCQAVSFPVKKQRTG